MVSDHLASMPDRQISDEQVEAYRKIYDDLIGFVPPRIRARTDFLARVDPELLAKEEELRQYCMYPDVFDVKTAQLMLFGMLLMTLSNAAHFHGLAAYRAGATFEELNAVVNLAFLFRGLPAANLGAQIIQWIAGNKDEDVP